jgi:hypothetical protein
MTILQNDQGPDKPGGGVGSVDTPEPVVQIRPVLIEPAQFYADTSVVVPGGVQGIVTCGRDGSPNDHLWNTRRADPGPWMVAKAKGKKPAYVTMAAYQDDKVSRFKGRAAGNVLALGGFWIDVEGQLEKGGYDGKKAVLAAVVEFGRDCGLTPTHIVMTGSGGAHLHYVLNEPITPAEWLGRARTLVALAAQHKLRIDAQCTTDAARIMRAPDSIHQKTGVEVKAYRWRENYTLAELDRLSGYVPGAVMVPGAGATPPKYDLSVNGDVVGAHSPYSYKQAAEKCAAMHRAAERNGRDTPYPVWVLAVKTADLSTEGREFAHEISCGHDTYDQAVTDKKIDSLTGGPAGCLAWQVAYGAGGPCETCEWRGKIKNPAVQFGIEVDVAPPGDVALIEPAKLPEWVSELNARYALARVGSDVALVDFKSPQMTARGMVYEFGFLNVTSFITLMKGRFAPLVKADERPKPLAPAWLEHQGRRQYAGLVYAPGEDLPSNILNLWQGFAVEPLTGDVSLWLEVLAAVVPGDADRRYVLRWLAWKIQNPGGVPDTILIFKGAKGTGKNSIFDPIVLLFGRHAMITGEPEMIVGRFNIHLMTLSFAVLDDAIFAGDPRQSDRIKPRVTGKTQHYEQKGMDPVQGVNRCAYVLLTNHEYVWQATGDERRAVVVEAGELLRGNLEFWVRYHAWVEGHGPAALLHYLQGVDLTGFNPRAIPKGEVLRKQIELTALREPAAAWWHQCLTEGAIRWRVNGLDRVAHLDDMAETEIDRVALRQSYEQSAVARGRVSTDWSAVSKRLKTWAGAGGMRSIQARGDTGRERRDVLSPLPALRAAFTAATAVQVSE